MKNKANLIILAVLLLFFPLFAEEESSEEKSRIQEVKEKIAEEKEKEEEKSEEKEEENEKEKEKDKNKKKSNDRHDSDSDFFYWLFRGIYDGFSDFLTTVRYADYPYARSSDFKFCSSINRDPSLTKIAFLNSSVEASYLCKDTRDNSDNYGVTVKVDGNLLSLHLNFFYQRIFSSEESLTLYSINGGISFASHSFMLTPFLGAFYIETLEGAQFSLGANLQIFLPANFIMDLYTLNSSYGSLNFNNFSASLNYAFYRINIGLGFNYNNYADVTFSGPLVKISFWL
jgi:hypothetical protein